MEKTKIQEIIISSIHELYKKDIYLFENKVNERTLVGQFACYLREHISNYDIDCEYNRNMDRSKKCGGNNHYPDLIIHKRGKNNGSNTDKNNLLYCECKTHWYKSEDQINKDIETIKCFMNNDDIYKYNYGLYIKFGETLHESTITFFYKDSDGKILEENFNGILWIKD